MKIAILGDTHFGARSGAKRFHDFFERFYDQTFFPYLEKHNINTVWQLGDLWDQRKQIPLLSVKEARRYFFDRLQGRNIQLYTLLGNHDIAYRDTVEVNSSSLLLDGYECVHIIDYPTELTFGSLKTLWLPWICADNYEAAVKAINKSQAPMCLGHLELKSFQMFKGHFATHGTLDRFVLQKFELVLSGHYHYRSSNENIYYVGTPYEMTWMDFDDPKGFHVFDTETLEIEFIPNPFVMFQKIVYDGSATDETFFEQYKNTIVQVVVQDKTNSFKFEKFIDLLQHAGCHELKIIEDVAKKEDIEYEATDDDILDTTSLLSNFIDQLEIEVDNEQLKKYVHQLYIEALNVEV